MNVITAMAPGMGGNQTPNPDNKEEPAWNITLEPEEATESISDEDLLDDGTQDVSDLPELEEDITASDEVLSLDWENEPPGDVQDELLELDLPEESLGLSGADVADSIEDIVVLPWKTTGQFMDRSEEVPVQLDPSQPHSTWYTTHPELSTGTLVVHGISFTVPFHKTSAETDFVVLGRDALRGRILISATMSDESP